MANSAGAGTAFRPLNDVRVVEWCNFGAGAFAGKVLAALGADVLKIEQPGSGDAARRAGAFRGSPDAAHSGLFTYLNHAKRSVTIDPTIGDGLVLLRRLVLEWAEVFLVDGRPAVIRELGLHHESLHDARPDLVTASITPFGETDHAPEHVYPSQTSYYSGTAYLQPTGFLYEGSSNRAPLRLPAQIHEHSSGLQLALGVLSALWSRRQTGQGQHLDVSKQEAELHSIRGEIDAFPNQGVVRARQSVMPKPYEQVPGGSMSGNMPCSDGYVTTWLLEPYMPQNLANWLGNPAWSANARFLDAKAGDPMMVEFRDHVVEEFGQRSSEELYLGLQPQRVAVAPILSPKEVLDARQLQQREFFEAVAYEGEGSGTVKMPRLPFQVGGGSISSPGRAPELGEHNERIICGVLGYGLPDLAQLSALGAI